MKNRRNVQCIPAVFCRLWRSAFFTKTIIRRTTKLFFTKQMAQYRRFCSAALPGTGRMLARLTMMRYNGAVLRERFRFPEKCVHC